MFGPCFKALTSQGYQETDNTLRTGYRHRNSTRHKEQRIHPHVGVRTGITESVTAEVGLKGWITVCQLMKR